MFSTWLGPETPAGILQAVGAVFWRRCPTWNACQPTLCPALAEPVRHSKALTWEEAGLLRERGGEAGAARVPWEAEPLGAVSASFFPSFPSL